MERIAEKRDGNLNIEGRGTLEWELDHMVPMLRGLLELHLERVMERERDAFLGYARYGRKPVGMTNERNGTSPKKVMTRFGELELHVPRDRDGEFETAVVGRYQKREGKVNRLILEMFVGGLSTRRMKKLTQMLLGRGYSAATISNINKSLNSEMEAWLHGPIEEEIAVLFVDGLNLPVRRFHVSKESLLVALGITRDGRRRIVGVSLGARESAESWRQFFVELKKRGLKSAAVCLGVMDGLPGLETAFEAAFPKAVLQRCIIHKTWNVAAKLPRGIQRNCLAQMSRIFNAADEAQARERFGIWAQQWRKVAAEAVACLEKDLDRVLTFYRFPQAIWKKIRTTNIIERMFKEFRRRTRAMDSFPNEECCLRCVYAISRNLDQAWSRRPMWRGDPFGQGREDRSEPVEAVALDAAVVQAEEVAAVA